MEEETKNQEAVLEEPTGEQPAGESTPAEAPQAKEGKTDPLDEIDDIETLRAEAKKFRGISNRTSRKSDEKQGETPKEPTEATSNFVTKKDLEDRAEKSAIKLMTTATDTDNQSVAAMKEAIAENWDEIQTYYVNRSGREEPEQIAKDIRSAFILWADEKGHEADLTQLTSVAVLKGSNGKKPAPQKQEDPRFKSKPGPSSWYTKKST